MRAQKGWACTERMKGLTKAPLISPLSKVTDAEREALLEKPVSAHVELVGVVAEPTAPGDSASQSPAEAEKAADTTPSRSESPIPPPKPPMPAGDSVASLPAEALVEDVEEVPLSQAALASVRAEVDSANVPEVPVKVPASTSSTTVEPPTSPDQVPSTSRGLQVGDRAIAIDGSKRGTIRFIGSTEFKAGQWVGLELDPGMTGKNDGCVALVSIDRCPENCGFTFIL